MSNTPSGKVREQINPQSPDADSIAAPRRWVNWIKNIFGTPIPVFQTLYALALLSSMAGMEIFIWSTSVFTLIYILIDFFSREKEFHYFRLGVEVPMFALLTVVVLGLYFNAPNADFVFHVGEMRWMIALLLVTYSLDLFPGLNKYFYIFLIGGTAVACYALWQHFTGIDLVRGAARSAVTPAPYTGSDVFQNVGFFSHHLTYGYSFAMVICFSFSGFLLSSRKHPLLRFCFLLSTIIIAISLFWTYGRGVWIATIASFAVMTFYFSKKHFWTMAIVAAVVIGTLYKTNPGFQERFSSIWAEKYRSNDDRRDLWAANLEMLYDYPWLGVGYNENVDRTQEYYKKLNIKNDFGSHAHNNYIQILSTTGVFGFLSYMGFIIIMLLLTHRLWGDVPTTHFWHRVIVLGCIGAQIAFHTGGMTQFTFGDAEVAHMYLFLMAVVAYMAEKYSIGVVPDDYAL